MRLGIQKSRAFFAVEVLWSLWNIACHNEHAINFEYKDHTNVISGFVGRMKFLSQLGKNLKSNVSYGKKWNTVNTMIDLL